MQVFQSLSAKEVKLSVQYTDLKIGCILRLSISALVIASAGVAGGLIWDNMMSLALSLWAVLALPMILIICRAFRDLMKMEELVSNCSGFVYCEAQKERISSVVDTYVKTTPLIFPLIFHTVVRGGVIQERKSKRRTAVRFCLRTQKGKKVYFFQVYRKLRDPFPDEAQEKSFNGTEKPSAPVIVAYNADRQIVLTFTREVRRYEICMEDRWDD